MVSKSVFARRLKKSRLNKKLTQEDLASLIFISRASYTSYEIGNHQPNVDTLILISKTLNCSIDYLLGLSNINKIQK